MRLGMDMLIRVFMGGAIRILVVQVDGGLWGG